ncbi:MAG: mechanosensitive ion channel family protein [Flavobacteriaceae bacterium]
MFYLKATFFENYNQQIVATLITVVVFFVLRAFFSSIVKKVGKKSELSEARTNLVWKYINMLISTLTIVALVTIWGVGGEDIFLVISSVLTIIGVAFFAQWSILSNVTAGIILFFSFPFKIGDRIRIMDKDFPVEAEIEDIKSFYTLLKTADGEEIAFPNNLLLQKGIVIVAKEAVEEKDFTD